MGMKAAHTAMPVKPNTGASKKAGLQAVLGIKRFLGQQFGHVQPGLNERRADAALQPGLDPAVKTLVEKILSTGQRPRRKNAHVQEWQSRVSISGSPCRPEGRLCCRKCWRGSFGSLPCRAAGRMYTHRTRAGA